MSTPASPPPGYPFFSELARILNSGQSRSVLLCGNVHDLFFVPRGDQGDYVPLIDYLCEKCRVPGLLRVVYELNGPVRFADEADRQKMTEAWLAWKLQAEPADAFAALANKKAAVEREVLTNDFNARLQDAIGKPAVALELMRQMTLCSRSRLPGGKRCLADNLLLIIEAGDFLLPAGDGDITRLSGTDRQRVSIVQDWFSEAGFMNGSDSVILLAESRSLVHPRVARLPGVISVEIPSPDQQGRRQYIDWFLARSQGSSEADAKPASSVADETSSASPPAKSSVLKMWAGPSELADMSAGLSIHALRQLLLGAAHAGSGLSLDDVIVKVEDFIRSQLGDDVVEFKKPSHSLVDVVGFTRLKEFVREELIPRFQSSGADALSGAAVAGPIGGGKTFIFEAAAAALDLPVLVLKNIRSQWYGQTDVIFERLRRVLEALVKVVIFVDEADTQFGGVGADAHETERRLTGKIQQMMSDPALRGKVIWLLMTARIHLLSPDIRRPGRVGDLIIPVLDPEGDDRLAFLKWTVSPALAEAPNEADLARLDELTKGYSAAAFASLRSHLKAKASKGKLSIDDVAAVIHDHIQPAIEETRRYQTLQALVNCTRRTLLPDPATPDAVRAAWQKELQILEARGIR